MANDIIPLRIHGHLITEEFTLLGRLVSLYSVTPPKNPEGEETRTLLKEWEEWTPGQEHGKAHAIELAKHLNTGGKLAEFKPQVTETKAPTETTRQTNSNPMGGKLEQAETEDDTGKGE